MVRKKQLRKPPVTYKVSRSLAVHTVNTRTHTKTHEFIGLGGGLGLSYEDSHLELEHSYFMSMKVTFTQSRRIIWTLFSRKVSPLIPVASTSSVF